MLEESDMRGKILVTGVAGFIGSHLAERLLKEGFGVVGVDSFEDYYPQWIKEKNIHELLKNKNFHLLKASILQKDLFSSPLLKNVRFIFHQAAQAGVRKSWGKNFEAYTSNNILATQRLLEFARDKGVEKFIYASSSSVYGNTDVLPVREDATTRPLSPYGVSKLAGENLCYLYFKNFGISTVSLRYFTVYGPRQRPDMAFHRFIRGIVLGEEIELYGDGTQTRDFTYVDDVIEANILSLNSPAGETFNIGGGKRISIVDALRLIEKLTGRKAKLKKLEAQKGDLKDTWADIEKAKKVIGYKPKVGIEEGLEKEIEWIKKIYTGKSFIA